MKVYAKLYKIYNKFVDVVREISDYVSKIETKCKEQEKTAQKICIALSKCTDGILKYEGGEVNIDSDVIKTHAFALSDIIEKIKKCYEGNI